jgi:hypothetical protein
MVSKVSRVALCQLQRAATGRERFYGSLVDGATLISSQAMRAACCSYGTI